MASFATLQPSPLTHHLRLTSHRIRFPLPCRAFKSSESDPSFKKPAPAKPKGALYSLKSLLLRTYGPHSWPDDQYKKAVEKAEDFFFSFATQLGRYCVTMMSTGVVVLVGFQLSGGNSHLNELIWYSWLGGIIIGTMIGANMVLDEHSRAGPRNVVITGR